MVFLTFWGKGGRKRGGSHIFAVAAATALSFVAKRFNNCGGKKREKKGKNRAHQSVRRGRPPLKKKNKKGLFFLNNGPFFLWQGEREGTGFFSGQR